MWNPVFGSLLRCVSAPLVGLVLQVALAQAAVSINLALDDPAYPLLEKLVSSNLTWSNALTIKPITRLYAARLIAEATQQRQRELADTQRQEPFLDQTLQYLARRFQKELQQIGFFYQPQPSDDAFFIAPLTEFKLDLIGAHDQFVHRDSSGFTSNLQGVFGLQSGFTYGNDFSTRLRSVSWATLWQHVAVYLEPELIGRSDPLLGDVFDVDLFTGYLKASYANLELEFGRDALWWGPASQGDLVLSNNAPPLELLKLSTPLPFRIPWMFQELGEWQVAYFVARLEHDRTIPHALVNGLRVTLQPTSYLRVGFTNVVQAYGEDGVSIAAQDFVPRLFVPSLDTTGRTVNGLVAYDVVLSLPFVRDLPWLQSVKFYWQRGNDNVKDVRGALGGGNILGGVIDGGRWDVRIEFAETRDADTASTIWYNHPTYQDGFAFRRFVLGHPMGGAAESLYGRMTYYLAPTTWLAADGRRERYGLDLQATPTTQWRFGLEASHEIMLQQRYLVLWGRIEYATLDTPVEAMQRAIVVQLSARWRF
jgi:Capsule assembly protein Wzi